MICRARLTAESPNGASAISKLAGSSPDRLLTRFGGFPVQGKTAAHFDPDRGLGGTGGYSRIDLARPKVPAFAGTSALLGRFLPELSRLAFGLAGPFREVARERRWRAGIPGGAA